MLWIVPGWMIRREYLVLVMNLRLPLPEIPSGESMEWTTLTEGVIPCVLASNLALSEAEIRRRWEEGQRCLLCWIKGSLAYYRWETTKPAYLPYLGRTFRPCQRDIFILEAFTHPAFRGRRINTIASIVALNRARDLGCARSIAMVARWNAPALKVSWQKVGRVVIGTVGYWNLGLWRYYFTTGDVGLDESGSVYIQL